ncbi:MAG: glycosyltransferase family 4 protein [candidate division Zixibacteria bacterium]
MDTKRKIIFLNRKNPESIGGVQRYIARLCAGLSNSFEIEKIGWNGPEWGAPIFFPLFYYKSIRNGAELVHCDDAVTAIVGARIKKKSTKKVIAAVHGLDVILPIPWYQDKIRKTLMEMDKVICVSAATAKQVRIRGVSDDKIEIIPSVAEKVENSPPKNDLLYQRLQNLTGIDLRGKKVLFSLGRPVRRKGFDTFITDIFPHLPENCVYIIAGPAPKTPSWIKALGPLLGEKYHRLLLLASGCDTVHDELIKLSSHPRVHYLNEVSDDLRDTLFALSDLFIMPNRTVEGDMEGFGIVALEASARGVPVIATGIEGITDAVIDGHNGYCVGEGETSMMIDIIKSFLDDPRKLADFGTQSREFTENNFSSEKVHARYEKVISGLLDSGKG